MKKITPQQVFAFREAFAEWERRYREEPERFMSECQKLMKQTPSSYGVLAAEYFVHILMGKI
jgi:hypothetical protein